MKKFQDNSVAPIVAWDFDGLICVGDSYPDPNNGKIRPYIVKVMNFLAEIGVKNIINTSRDVAIVQDGCIVQDDITSMMKYLRENKVMYSAINKSVQYAPFTYNSRKIYAHMYVDDRGYGWREHSHAALDVLVEILVSILEVPYSAAYRVRNEMEVCAGVSNETIQEYKKYVKDYWK